MRNDYSLADGDTVEQELVSYMDGELGHEESSAIEQRLARDPKLRDKLRRLQRAWDMLDYLPRTHPRDEFTRSTVELVAVQAAEEMETKTRSRPASWRLQWIIGIAATVVAVFVGYGISRYVLTAPNRQLLTDLPVIENVDLYHHIDSIEFLECLDSEGLFANEIDEVGDAT